MKGKVQRVGYTRVSTVDQNTSRQLEGIALDRTFSDAASGKDVRRPQLQAAIEYVRDGDTLVVHSMDRLARNLDDLRATVQKLTSRGIRVEFIKENLTFTGDDSPMANLLLSMLGAVAQFERELIKERQREGIAIAKAKGDVYRGRQFSLGASQVEELRSRLADGESKSELARELGLSRATIYNYLSDEHFTLTKRLQTIRNDIVHQRPDSPTALTSSDLRDLANLAHQVMKGPKRKQSAPVRSGRSGKRIVSKPSRARA